MTPSKIIINRITIMKQDSHFLKRTNLLILLTSLFLMACSGGGGTPTATDITAEATEVPNGSITPFSFSIATPGDRAFFTVTPNPNFQIGSVVGCSGELVGNTYTTGPLSASCTVTTSFTKITVLPADAATPILSYVQTKLFQFTWTDVADATFYRLMEQAKTGDGFTQVGPDIAAGVQAFDHIVTLYDRLNAQYILQSCNIDGCTDAPSVSVSGNLAGSIGYFKTSNTGSGDNAGESVSLSADGNTLAVGAKGESSNATGILDESGAVYVFTLSGTVWSQQAYLKASNPGQLDEFGGAVSLSEDGNTLAVGATGEDSNATGVGVDDGNDSAENSGAVYVFRREPGSTAWRQQAYLKASNTGAQDSFGKSVSVDGNGLSRTIAVGAHREDSDGSDEDDDSAENSGAVYVFKHSNAVWRQQAYLKAQNSEAGDQFGGSVSLDFDGNTLAVGATGEDSNITGVVVRDGTGAGFGGDQNDNSALDSGAVYVFTDRGALFQNSTLDGWLVQSYIKASNNTASGQFGGSVSLSGNNRTLAVGAAFEASSAIGVNGNPSVTAGNSGGAVYVFESLGSSFWNQKAYLKASNGKPGDLFGFSVSLNLDGTTLVSGAPFESTNASGAVYLY
jgi:hypothetical protein